MEPASPAIPQKSASERPDRMVSSQVKLTASVTIPSCWAIAEQRHLVRRTEAERMLKLRKFLASLFGTLSFLGLIISLGTVPSFFRHPFGFSAVAHQHLPLGMSLYGGVLVVFASLLLLLPLVLGVLYGIAWWTAR